MFSVGGFDYTHTCSISAGKRSDKDKPQPQYIKGEQQHYNPYIIKFTYTPGWLCDTVKVFGGSHTLPSFGTLISPLFS